MQIQMKNHRTVNVIAWNINKQTLDWKIQNIYIVCFEFVAFYLFSNLFLKLADAEMFIHS